MQNSHLTNQLVRLALVMSLWLAPLAWGQNVTAPRLNATHGLLRNLEAWWLVQPRLFGGATWWNIFPQYPLALTTMAAGSGWGTTSRAGWAGEVRLDGTDDYLAAGPQSVFDCTDRTCTLQVRFRTTMSTTANVAAKRDPAGGQFGGWFLRGAGAGAQLIFRITDLANGSVFERTSTFATVNSGVWLTVHVVMTTDTVTIANNTATIYINGVVDTGTTGGGATGNAYSPCSGCSFNVGAAEAGNGPMIGAVDDVRFWSRGLSAQEVLAAYRSAPPNFGGLVAPAAVTLLAPGAGPKGSFFPFFQP
jgi:hypothetical protein